MPRPLTTSARYGLAAMVLLLLITASFRLERLMTIPPGMHGDLAQYISDGLRISRSWSFPLSLDSRPEPLWRWMLGVLVWWTGAVPFAEQYGGIAVGLLTVAATYRATLELLRLWRWTTPLARRLGALIAATAITSNVALQFINRQGFRAGLLPLALAIILLLWARAWRFRRPRDYAWAGLAAGFPVNVYTAGLLAPLVGIGTLVYLLILGRRDACPSRRNAALLLVMLALATAPQLYLALRVPDLYGHIRQMQVGDNPKNADAPLIPALPELVNRLNKATRTFYATGYYALNYNTPDTPFLNPLLALLALVGALAAILQWRILPGVLAGAMLVAMIFPGALSMDPDDSIRLIGTFVPLAVLAGFGCAALVRSIERLSERQHGPLPGRALTVTALACLLISPTVSRLQFDAFWVNPKFWADPEYWLSFPHYFSINFTDYLTLLQHVDHPVYVPMPQIDSATGSWYLLARAYPNVKVVDALDPLAGAQGLPDGELWYPYAAEYNVALPNPAEQFALLLPGPDGRGGTVVILPPLAAGTAASLRARAEKDGAPIIDTTYGWRLGWRLPVTPADITAPAQRAEWHDIHARFGDSIELLGYEAPLTLTPAQKVRATLYWRALKPMRFDAFSFAQFLDGDNRPYGTDDVWLYHWVYPSVFWKTGDVIPDVRVMELPPEMPQGAYKFAAGIYTEPRQERLPVADADGRPVPDNWLTLENHRIALLPMPAAPADAAAVNAQFGAALVLDAYTSDLPLAEARPGQSVHLRQYWHASSPVDRSYTLFIHVMDKSGKMIAQQDVQPLDGRYPTNVWAVGEPITVDFTLTIPADAAPGPYDWRVGAYSFPSLERLTVSQDGQQPQDRRAVLR